MSVVFTTWAHCDRFFHPFLLVSGDGHWDEQDHAQASAHPQTWGGQDIILAPVGLCKLQCSDGLFGVPVNAGYTGTARAGEGVFTTL